MSDTETKRRFLRELGEKVLSDERFDLHFANAAPAARKLVKLHAGHNYQRPAHVHSIVRVPPVPVAVTQ